MWELEYWIIKKYDQNWTDWQEKNSSGHETSAEEPDPLKQESGGPLITEEVFILNLRLQLTALHFFINNKVSTTEHIFGENHNPKRCMHPNVHCSITYNN